MLVPDCFQLWNVIILFVLNILLDNQNIVFVSSVFVLLSLCIFVVMSVIVHGEVTCLSDIDIEFTAVSHELFNTSSPSLPPWATDMLFIQAQDSIIQCCRAIQSTINLPLAS